MGLPAERVRGHPGRHRPDEFTPPPAGQPATPTRSWSSPAPTCRSRAWCTCSRRWRSCAPSGPSGSPSSAPPGPGGPAEAALDRLALRDAVRFTGPVPEAELVQLLQRAAVVAIPSLYEGFSLPADRGDGLRDAAGHHRRGRAARGGRRRGAGCGCAPATSGELTAALQRVLDSPSLAEQLGRAGRRRVLDAVHLAGDGAAHADWYADDPRPQGRRSADRRLRPARPPAGDDRPRPGLRRGPARVRGVPPGRARRRRRLGAAGGRDDEALAAARSPRPARPRPGAALRGGPRRPAAPARSPTPASTG